MSNRSEDTHRIQLIPALSVLLFFLAGLAVLPYPGMQNDELFFVGPLYLKSSALYQIHIRSRVIPLMLLSYLGALKTWIYFVLLKWFPPSVWTVRLPMLLGGALTVWLTWLWVRRIAGERAAAVAAVLLATDTSYLLTATFDWGPVVLQHLFLIAGLLALQVWLDEPRRAGMPALALFLWGLGLWDKALLIWPLAGLAVAVLCVYPREAFTRVRGLPSRWSALALLAFLIGASPLVKYNLAQHGSTASQNAKFSTEGLGSKIAALKSTIQGDVLYGYLVYEPSTGHARAPQSTLERTADWITRHFGNHRHNLMLQACFLALLCFGVLAFLRSKMARTIAFLLIAITVEWLQMALTTGAGTGAHHTILVWPLLPVFVAIALSALANRIPRFGAPLLVALVAVLAAGNLLTTNQFLAASAEEGGYQGWTDAIYPLVGYLETQGSHWIGLIDWGYQTQLQLLDKGRLRIFDASDADQHSEDITRVPDAVFVEHTADLQMFPRGNERFHKAAEALGYVEKPDRVIPDGNGRPVFEVFHLEALHPEKPADATSAATPH